MFRRALPRTAVIATTLLVHSLFSTLSAGPIIAGNPRDSDEFIHAEERREAMLNVSTSILDQRLLVPSIEDGNGIDAFTDVKDSQTMSTTGHKQERESSGWSSV